MKKTINLLSKSILLVFGICFIFYGKMAAQSCSSVFEFCQPVDAIFNKQSFARSYKIKPSQKLKLVQVFYASTGYNINLCKDDKLGDFRIRVLQWESNTVLWDNKDDDFITNVSISFGSTQRIIIEVTPENPDKFNEIDNCLGVVIRYYREEKPQKLEQPEGPPDKVF